MGGDGAPTATTPNYAWIAAAENHNMEGPVNIEFILSLLTNHQCNIEAGDRFLADTLPTMLNSPAFQTQRSVIFIPWDEDYDNLSLGIGNEGNHCAQDRHPVTEFRYAPMPRRCRELQQPLQPAAPPSKTPYSFPG